MKYYVEQHNKPEKDNPDLVEMIKNLHAQKTENYVSLLNQNAIPLRPGVKRLLHEARAANIRLAIATTTTPQNVTALLENALGKESLNWFEVIGAGDIVPHKKPAADIYDYVLTEMDLSASHCVAFEDSINGIKSARGANLTTVITYNGYTEDDDFSDALLVLDKYGDPDDPSEVLQNTTGESYLTVENIIKLSHEVL